MEESDLDYDLRQLELMQLQLSQFDTKVVTLNHLITGLRSLLLCLRTLDKDWKDLFTGDWWILEQVYAVALDNKKTVLSPTDEALIKEAVGNLRALVAGTKERLKRTRNESGPNAA